jgi:hypothetical protein
MSSCAFGSLWTTHGRGFAARSAWGPGATLTLPIGKPTHLQVEAGGARHVTEFRSPPPDRRVLQGFPCDLDAVGAVCTPYRSSGALAEARGRELLLLVAGGRTPRSPWEFVSLVAPAENATRYNAASRTY